MKKSLFPLLALCVAANYGCNASTAASPEKAALEIEMTTEKQELVSGYNAMGFSLLNTLAKRDENKNTLVSPLSIASALAMAKGGAAGQTECEMARVLGVGKVSEKNLEADNLALFSSLQDAKDVELSLANSLWLRQGFAINADFQSRTKKTYDTKVASLDFASPSATQQINDWVKASTRGKIDKMIEKLSADDVLVLMNAVYFRGNWLEKFDPKTTRDAPFFAPDGKRDVPMMERSDHFRYAENAEMQAVALPYKGNRMALYVLLPQKEKDLNALLSSMNAEKFDALAKTLISREGSVSLPRFKMTDDIDLIPPLQSLGMKAAFGAADFSRIAPSLFISGVRHKAVIEVNETGTEAAAATSIAMAGSAAPIDKPKPFVFIANRPFLLALRDDQSGALLFLGITNSPEVVK